MQRKIIGITGGIGSGKTTVSQIITSKGFPVYNSDNRAKEIVNENQDIQQKIIYLLGEKAYENGVYNHSFVANCVFNNNELLQKLNEIIHPAVRQDFLDFVDRQNSQFIFRETAILFELGLDKDCDEVILVTANAEMRIERVMVRDGRTRQEIEQIIAKQMPENEKIQISDYVIYNNQNDF